jgi:hypothetical protein
MTDFPVRVKLISVEQQIAVELRLATAIPT